MKNSHHCTSRLTHPFFLLGIPYGALTSCGKEDITFWDANPRLLEVSLTTNLSRDITHSEIGARGPVPVQDCI